MESIQRNIVGALILSLDHRVLLGYNKKGGVFQGQLTIPGGGIEDGETIKEALVREVLEETGLNIRDSEIIQIEIKKYGKSKKIVNNKEVSVKMTFNDFLVKVPKKSRDIKLKFNDDFHRAKWYEINELKDLPIAKTVEQALQNISFIVQ